jgi:hypothetical protein
MSLASWTLLSCVTILAAITIYAFRDWKNRDDYKRRCERLTCEDIVRRAQARNKKDAREP